MTYRPKWDDVRSAAFVGGNDAPLIGERAAMRSSAMKLAMRTPA